SLLVRASQKPAAAATATAASGYLVTRWRQSTASGSSSSMKSSTLRVSTSASRADTGVPCLVVAAAEEQTDQETDAGRDEQRAARVVAHEVGEILTPGAHVLLHLAVALAEAAHRALDLLARRRRGALGLAAHLLGDLLVALTGAARHL